MSLIHPCSARVKGLAVACDVASARLEEAKARWVATEGPELRRVAATGSPELLALLGAVHAAIDEWNAAWACERALARLLAGTTTGGQPPMSTARTAYTIRDAAAYAGPIERSAIMGANLAALPPAQRKRLAAALAIAQRLASTDIPAGDFLSHPEAVARYLTLRYGKPSQEVMGALFLDIRNRLAGECELYTGTLSRAAVEPRAIFERALACRAAGFIVFHNHPSGDPGPSAEDLVFTRRLADAGETMGILLVDHIITGSAGRFTSLRRTGGW